MPGDRARGVIKVDDLNAGAKNNGGDNKNHHRPMSESSTSSSVDADNNNHHHSNPNRKQDPPPYGSQDYWEERYRQVFYEPTKKSIPSSSKSSSASQQQQPQTLQQATKKSDDDDDDDDNHNDGPLAYHAWYFTYEELQPIIMPIILGGAPPSTEEEEDDDDDDDEHDTRDEHKIPSLAKPQSNNDRKRSSTADSKQDSSDVIDQPSTRTIHANDTVIDGDDRMKKEENYKNDHDEEEIDDDDDDDDEDDDEIIERSGLVNHGPIFVLEIGCGDVPLGTGLALELLSLEEETKQSALGIVRKIACIDYSASVIEWMQRQYRTDLKTKTLSLSQQQEHRQKKQKLQENDETFVDLKHIPLEFAAMDARKMPYPDESVDLILEKGTLDAMLSDKQKGKQNSIQTVTECARVLRKGGYIMLVSHLNAHTPNGICWLKDVVFTGLKQGSKGLDVSWEIEVHGNDGTTEAILEGVPEGSIGPAVYIIHKMIKHSAGESHNNNEATIPVRFFSY